MSTKTKKDEETPTPDELKAQELLSQPQKPKKKKIPIILYSHRADQNVDPLSTTNPVPVDSPYDNVQAYRGYPEDPDHQYSAQSEDRNAFRDDEMIPDILSNPVPQEPLHSDVPEWFKYLLRPNPEITLERDFTEIKLFHNSSKTEVLCGVSYRPGSITFRPPFSSYSYQIDRNCPPDPLPVFEGKTLAFHLDKKQNRPISHRKIHKFLEKLYDIDFDKHQDMLGAKTLDFHGALESLLEGNNCLVLFYFFDQQNFKIQPCEKLESLDYEQNSCIRPHDHEPPEHIIFNLVLTYNAQKRSIESEVWLSPWCWDKLRYNVNNVAALIAHANEIGSFIQEKTRNKNVTIETKRHEWALFECHKNKTFVDISENRTIKCTEYVLPNFWKGLEVFWSKLEYDFQRKHWKVPRERDLLGLFVYEECFMPDELRWLETQVENLQVQSQEKYILSNGNSPSFLRKVEHHLVRCGLLEPEYINCVDIIRCNRELELPNERSEFLRPTVMVQLKAKCDVMCREVRDTITGITLKAGNVCILTRDSFAADGTRTFLAPVEENPGYVCVFRRMHENINTAELY